MSRRSMRWLTLTTVLLLGCGAGFRPLEVGPADAAGDGPAPAPDGGARDGAGDRPVGPWELVHEDPQAGATESLNAIWAADADHVFAAGDNGQLVFFDGRWQALNKTAGVHFYGLFGRSASEVLAVGLYAYNGTPAIYRYDGALWSPEGPIPDGVQPLAAAWGSGSQTYFVGAAGRIYQDDPVRHPEARYHLAVATGGCPRRSDPPPALWSIDGSGLENILVAGDQGLLAHFNLQSWTRLCHPEPAVAYRAVFRLPGTSDFLVGGNFLGLYRFAGREAPLTVIHQDRASPGVDRLHLWAIWGPSAASVLAVGDAGAILYWDGGPSGVRRLLSPTTGALFGVWGLGDGTVYLCGQGNKIWRASLARLTAPSAP